MNESSHASCTEVGAGCDELEDSDDVQQLETPHTSNGLATPGHIGKLQWVTGVVTVFFPLARDLHAG